MAHDGDMQIPQSVARFNRRVTNPIQRLWAGRAPTFGILEHVGRKSGKAFRVGNFRYQNGPNSHAPALNPIRVGGA